MIRRLTTFGIVVSLAMLASVLGFSTASAQPGTVLSYPLINSLTLGPLGAQIDDGDEFGDAVAYLGDLDGAGPSVAAMAVGAIADDDGGNHRGAVWILFLNSAGAVISHQKISSTAGGFTGALDSQDEFGSSVAWLGDLDGAGPSVGALAVGAIGDDDEGFDRGAVYILFLNAAGQVLTTKKIITSQVGLPFETLADEEQFGGAVAGLGDLDGAGPSAMALAVGAIADDDGGVNRGAVFIVYLSSAGNVLSYSKISSTAGGFTAALDDNDNFAEDLANLGDLDGGPGVRTLAVTAVDDDDGGTDSGAVYLIHLTAAGTVSSWKKISRTTGGFSGPVVDTDNFGTAVTGLGDLDGAGPSTTAIAVAAGSDDGLGFNRGAIYILFLNSSLNVISYKEISSTAGGSISSVLLDDDEFGSALTALGDINGAAAGAQTLVSGVGYDDDGGLQRGAAYVIQLEGGTASGAPVVTAPATASGPENAPLTVNVTASDPNGDAITSLTATGLPSGATFTPGAGNTTGTLNWTPTFSQSGSYTVTFTASNALSGSSSTAITITNVDRAPVVTSPATATVAENAPLTVNVTVSDPDGQAITTLTASGLPAGATFTPVANKTSGTLSWTPSFSQSGSYTVTFTATNALSGSSSTAITVTNVDRAPTLSAPATASGPENAPLTVNVSASDPDGQAISSLTATGVPSGATFTPGAGNTTGTLSWTPTFSQSGSYTVTFTATNALSGSSSTAITITNVDRAPVVSAPATASGPENAPLTVNVSASDADGQAITSLTATGVPSGATFTPGPGNTTGTLSWTPGFGQSGSHTVTFTATNSSSGSSSTEITVTNVDRSPTVSAPATESGPENSALTVHVTAADPDGEAITTLTATGLPTGATFTPGAGNTTGTLDWTPGFDQSGSHTVTFTATNALSGSSTTVITVSNLDRAPTVSAPPTASGPEGSPISVNVTAADADGEAITSLVATGMPTGATFTPGAGNTSGTFDWSPDFDQSGTYTVTFTATSSQSGSSSTTLTIGELDRSPVVSVAPTASGPEDAPIVINLTVSDPDGQPITSLTVQDKPTGAIFSPGAGNTTGTLVWTPTYGQAGTYTVTFTASNALSGSSSTEITIGNVDRAPVISALPTAYSVPGAPVAVVVTITDPDGDPITTLEATGLPDGATFVPGAENHSGQIDWTPALGQEGSYTVTFTATNALTSSCSTVITIGTASTGVGPLEPALLRPALSPSPLRTRATLSFRTSQAGAVQVELLDLSGRRVRELLHERDAAAGVHHIQIDGRSDRGDPLPSGVYLYRIRAPRNAWTGRLIITR